MKPYHVIIKALCFTAIMLLLALAVTASPCKKELRTTQEALQICLSGSSDTIIMYVKPKKAIKAQEKTERLYIESQTKIKALEAENERLRITVENKTKRKANKQTSKESKQEEKQKTKRNFVFQFFTTLKSFLRNLTVSQILGASGGVLGIIGMAEKFKPLTKVLGLFKK